VPGSAGASSAGASSSSAAAADAGAATGSKRRFDDTAYLEQSRELVDGVKSAVAAGLLKKRKKQKTTSPVTEGQGEASKAKVAPAKTSASTGDVAPGAEPLISAAAATPVAAVGA
jgi:hypothetical protein